MSGARKICKKRQPWRCNAFVFFALVSLLPAGGLGFFQDPPHDEVGSHNDALASSLLGVRLPVAGLRPVRDPLRHFAINVHAVYPSVDQAVSSSYPPKVLWGWSYDAQEEFDWAGVLSGCGSNRSRMRLASVRANFQLRSELGGRVVVFDRPANPAPVGFQASELASGGTLSVRLDGGLFLGYDRETQAVACRSYCQWNGCTYQSWVETLRDRPVFEYAASSPIFSSTVVVPSSQMVLPTPWIDNFSVFLPYLTAFAYSNSSWYLLQASLDGVETAKQRYFGFDTRADSQGALSVWTVSHAVSESSAFLPAKFSAQSSRVYVYAYRVDQSLSNATEPGMRLWSLKAVDVFGDAAVWSRNFSAHAGTRLNVTLSSMFLDFGQPLDVVVRLTDWQDKPLAGKTVQLESSSAVLNVTLDKQGSARVRLFLEPGAHRVVARFLAQGGFASAFADQVVLVKSSALGVSGGFARYDVVLLAVALMLALCLVRFR